PLLLLGAKLAPRARTVPAAVRVMRLALEHRFTSDHRVVNRAPRLARQGRRMLLGRLLTGLVPPGAPSVIGANDTVARRGGRTVPATGGERGAGPSTPP